MSRYGLTEYEARRVQQIFLMVRSLEEGGQFWPSGKDYGFTVKDALLHGQFLQFAKQEATANAPLIPSPLEGEEQRWGVGQSFKALHHPPPNLPPQGGRD